MGRVILPSICQHVIVPLCPDRTRQLSQRRWIRSKAGTTSLTRCHQVTTRSARPGHLCHRAVYYEATIRKTMVDTNLTKFFPPQTLHVAVAFSFERVVLFLLYSVKMFGGWANHSGWQIWMGVWWEKLGAARVIQSLFLQTHLRFNLKCWCW